MRPRAILVTGVPGSGKSTLARELSRLLRIPYLARDDVRGGLLFSAGAWTASVERIPSADEAVGVFLELVETMLGRGLSCVLEYVVRTSRPEDFQRILAAGDCVVIKTECAEPMGRFAQRNRGDRLVSQAALLHAAGYDSVEAHTAVAVQRMRQVQDEMFEQVPVPVLGVNTTDGYFPPIDDVVDFVTRSPSPQT